MTDRETLFIYRMNEAEETLADTRKMLERILPDAPSEKKVKK